MIKLTCRSNLGYINKLTIGNTYDLLYDNDGQFYIVDDNCEYGYFSCELFGY